MPPGIRRDVTSISKLFVGVNSVDLEESTLELKGELYPKPKLSMFCALFHFFLIKTNLKHDHDRILKQNEKLKNGITMIVGQTVPELLIKTTYVLIDNSRTACPTKKLMPYLRFLKQLQTFRFKKILSPFLKAFMILGYGTQHA